ncbi:uncharacterized protein LOC129115992 [Anoplopoma fimbria]|uniref:uncharacterized protein LOC129115992 n=1 Tax=Anoplopoma fimbria TaxID=229290 RepID=UPI0023EB20E1|nr:uncharacterized protein LOC129115992 [Anoplopoma fimbria]XP_054483103.1 uncharacterized protein LOC129115992 [Anoplopoma fimbria]XP_054483104.1 uncharacterized protein LOC129115992 [Anoplopoma fimbria]XP_054483105.1 uncharacterized protein LOC129115992 [Anoplopoma fimbria]XP_054483107.1 uncharacterized protein LOC129115992 [Anoplopoma fimbria]
MIFWILLLFILTSSSSGSFVVNVTQSSYQAEENHNITLEWTFTTNTQRSSNYFSTLCQLFTDVRHSVLFHIHDGVEAPESQDEQFAGRVQWDKDVLREGRLRLHVSRLRTADSGLYLCDVLTRDGANSRQCHLNVTAERDRPKHDKHSALGQGTDPSPTDNRTQPESRGRIVLYCVLGLTAAVLVLFTLHLCIVNKISPRQNQTNSIPNEAVLLRL